MAQAAKLDGDSRPPRTRYEHDLYSWVQEQVALLRSGRLDEIDVDNVAEELSDVGRSERWKLWSILRVLVMHMLKWDQQPEQRTPSWVHSIREQRRRYGRLMESSPSLQGSRGEVLADIYPIARGWASDETGIPEDEFPSDCPYAWDDILARPFEADDGARRPR